MRLPLLIRCKRRALSSSSRRRRSARPFRRRRPTGLPIGTPSSGAGHDSGDGVCLSLACPVSPPCPKWLELRGCSILLCHHLPQHCLARGGRSGRRPVPTLLDGQRSTTGSTEGCCTPEGSVRTETAKSGIGGCGQARSVLGAGITTLSTSSGRTSECETAAAARPGRRPPQPSVEIGSSRGVRRARSRTERLRRSFRTRASGSNVA